MQEPFIQNQLNRRKFLTGCSAVALSACTPKLAPKLADVSSQNKIPPVRDYIKNLDHLAVAAHRGVWQVAPENSIPSLQACLDFGVEFVEIDLRVTADDVPIIWHDRDLERMTGLNGFPSDMKLKDFSKLTLLDKDGSSYNPMTKYHPPTLEEVLYFAKNKPLYVRLDIKKLPENKSIVRKIIHQAGMENHIQIHTEVNREKDLDIIRRQQDEFGCLVNPVIKFKKKRLPRIYPMLEALNPSLVDTYSVENIELLEELSPWLKERDIKLQMCTLKNHYSIAGHYDTHANKNPDKAWGELHRAGADIIMTAKIKEFTNWRAQSGYGPKV